MLMIWHDVNDVAGFDNVLQYFVDFVTFGWILMIFITSFI